MLHSFTVVIVLGGLWLGWMKGRSIQRNRLREQTWHRVQEVIQL